MAENKGAFILDHAGFEKNFLDFALRTAPKALARGLFKAGSAWTRDAIEKEPRAPHVTGALWRSQQVNMPDFSKTDEISVTAGFNIAYAAYQHEGVREDGSYVVKNYTMDGSGPKFLEAKAAMYGSDYLKIASDETFLGIV